MNGFLDHPGYLGFTSRGVILIHADWPVYAIEHGWEYALVSFGLFPSGTVFHSIDDIDRCHLFLVGDVEGVPDPFDEKHIHVAAWHEDILELLELGLVDGVSRDLDQYDDDRPVAVIADSGLTVTGDGFVSLQDLITAQEQELVPEIGVRLAPLLEARQYDTAIREACVVLETRLRHLARSELHGRRLVDRYFSELMASGRFIPAHMKTLRAEVRTLFKFVRNEYMHNLKDIREQQCRAIITRISWVFEALPDVPLQ